MVKHGENENSITKTNKKHSTIDFSDLQLSFSLCFHSQYVGDLALYEVFLQSELSRDVFLTCSWISQLKHLVLRAFLAGNLTKKLSKLDVLNERGMKKSNKSIALECHPSHFCGKSKYNLHDLEQFPGFPGFHGFCGNVATGRCSDPPFHTRRGPI